LLIASSRPGTQPANLQGIWNDAIKPPWESKYTVNINTEMNYWPAEVTALAECTAPLVQMVRELAITGERTARTMYGARGWVCHHNTDLWRATAPIDGAQWGLWPTGGAWLCTHLWDRYDYGRDLAYLRSVYPLMRGAALFFLDTLQTDPATGALVTNPSLSPENIHPAGASICAGPAMDMQILRDLFDQVGQAAALLKIDAPFATEVAAARARLAPDHIGAQGQLQEWQRDWDAAAPEPHHRHVSHLYGLFPSDQIDLDRTPALAQAARRSLELRGDESTGWATAWRANLWARLRDGDHAHRILAFLLGPERTYPNLFDAHPPFQIDGNFGGTRAIAEMLMQSRGDEILLLPALPGAWPVGSVTGLRARGRCSVDLRWQKGELVEAVVRGEVPGRRVIRLGARGVEVVLSPGKAVRLRGTGLARA
ncbi:MAG: glycoside hydrolase family 95 protein, partial [Sphingomonas sp.]